MGDERGQQKNDHRDGHAERTTLSEPGHLRREAIDRDAVAEHQRETARHPEHAEGDDEGRNVALGDEKAVDGAGEARRPRGSRECRSTMASRGLRSASRRRRRKARGSSRRTDRCPADEMTKVMPIASTPNTDVDRRMLRMLETERKALDRNAITADRTARTTSDSRRSAAPPGKRARQDDAALLAVEAIVKGSPGLSRRPHGAQLVVGSGCRRRPLHRPRAGPREAPSAGGLAAGARPAPCSEAKRAGGSPA